MTTLNHDASPLKAWAMWGMAALFYLFQFVIRVCPSIMADDWMMAYAIDASSLGVVAAFYYYAYCGVQIPLGVIMDKLGPRIMLSVAALICALGCVLMATSTSIITACLGRFMMGLGAAGGFIGALKVATLWFPAERIGVIAGLTTALGTVGGISGQAPLSILNEHIGWQGSLFVLSGIGVVLSAAIAIFISPPKSYKEKASSSAEDVSITEALKLIVANPQIWLAAFYGCMMYVPIAALADLWGVPFLKSVYLISEPKAASMVSSIYLGLIAGGILVGKFINLLKSRKRAMRFGILSAIFFYSIVIFIHPLPEWAVYVCFFFAGMSFAPECMCFVLSCEHVPKRYTGIALGFTNMVVMLSGVVMQPLVGALIELDWDGAIINGIPVYDKENYMFALALIPILLGIGAFILTKIKDPNFPVSQGKRG